MKSNIIIIGGGASGLMAAVLAARSGASVTILEHMPKIGKKILATGNGRCNYTNMKMETRFFHSNHKKNVSKILEQFDENDTLNFFEKLGILPKDKEGYIYPNSLQASSILDALIYELERLKVNVCLNTKIHSIAFKKNQFYIQTDEDTYICHRLILATGGKASKNLGSDGSGYELARSLGHHISPVVPALTGLKAKERIYKQLSGIRIDGKVSLYIDHQLIDSHIGELQLAEYGISGIPVFQLSGQAALGLLHSKHVYCELDFFPNWSENKLNDYLWNRKKQMKPTSIEAFETGLLNRKLIHACIQQISHTKKESFPNLKELAHLLKHFPATISESRGFDFAQVCAGGVELNEIDPMTCQSKILKNLYIVGELLDADGICGGYNLQWAWSTGYIAGTHAGKDAYASNKSNKNSI